MREFHPFRSGLNRSPLSRQKVRNQSSPQQLVTQRFHLTKTCKGFITWMQEQAKLMTNSRFRLLGHTPIPGNRYVARQSPRWCGPHSQTSNANQIANTECLIDNLIRKKSQDPIGLQTQSVIVTYIPKFQVATMSLEVA